MTNWVDAAVAMEAEGYRPAQIGKELGMSAAAVRWNFRRLGIETRKLKYDRSYFRIIDSEYKAYWLGFLYADGSVSFGRPRMVQLAISANDHDHLEKFAIHIGGDATLVKNYRQSRNSYSPSGFVSKLAFTSVEMVDSLVHLGFTPRKTSEAVPPELSTEALQVAFWRGVFDGDGCISKLDLEYLSLAMCGTRSTVEAFRDFMVRANPSIHCGKVRFHRNCHTILFACSNAMKVAEILYRGSRVHLDRKHQRFLEAINSGGKP